MAMFRNPAETEDVVQEIFVEAWRSFSRFEPGTNCRAWLFKILMHKASHHRRKWFRRMKEAPLDDVLENTVEAVHARPSGANWAGLLAEAVSRPPCLRFLSTQPPIESAPGGFSLKPRACSTNIPVRKSHSSEKPAPTS